MKVGILTASISRRAGGLFWSVRSLACGVQQAGFNVQVYSVVDAFSGEDAGQWSDLDLCLLPRLGPASFGYASGLGRALDTAGLELIHTHGLWMYPSLAAWRWSKRWGRPLIVSPRGMLDPWAIRNSAWKKRLAGMLFEHAHLRHAACLHALCESEYQSIRACGLSNPVAIIPNGVEMPIQNHIQFQPEWAANIPGACRVLLFLGRIHPKKGLVNLLYAWARVRQEISQSAGPWHLVIAGWDQGGHQGQLERLANDAGMEGSVHFVGPQYDEQKAASLGRADAFILPSLSEGLPMAVLEAWAYRLPVLMTPQCNLPEGFAVRAALAMEPDAGSIAKALARLFLLADEEREAMGDRGHALIEKHFTWPSIAARMCEVYKWVIGQEFKPECVVTD